MQEPNYHDVYVQLVEKIESKAVQDLLMPFTLRYVRILLRGDRIKQLTSERRWVTVAMQDQRVSGSNSAAICNSNHLQYVNACEMLHATGLTDESGWCPRYVV